MKENIFEFIFGAGSKFSHSGGTHNLCVFKFKPQPRLNVADSLPTSAQQQKGSDWKTKIFTSKNKSKERQIFLDNHEYCHCSPSADVCLCFSFFTQCACQSVCMCVCKLQYVGCHSYQNANLTASLLQTTFTQKKSCFSSHSSLHPLIYLSIYCLKTEVR